MSEPQYTNPLLILIGVLVVLAVGIVLHEMQSILLPFVISVFLSIIFGPLVVSLKSRNVPMVISLGLVLLSMALVLLLFSLILYSSTESFLREFPKYERRLNLLVTGIFEKLANTATDIGFNVEEIRWHEALQLSSITSAITSGVGTLINIFSNITLILLFMMFMLAGSGELGAKVKSAFPARQANQFSTIISNIETQVRQYLVTKTLVSAGTGAMAFLILWITGVDFALVWGFLSFLLNFIPNIGSIFAIAMPVTVSFLQFDTMTRPILVLILLAVMQTLMGNVLEPKLMAFRLNMSPLVVLVSLIFWGWLWGVWGMILAVPIMATMKIVFENITALKPLAILMSSKPPSAS
ncbi:MAG TPA: AI-2E family transporter [Bacteroidota bacterium]|nr:AI-2E family transporter [Bacteroidota bacterium]